MQRLNHVACALSEKYAAWPIDKNYVSTLWATNGNPHATAPQAVPTPQGARPDAKVQAHYCQPNGKPFQLHEKGGKVWYSHKAPDGSWCNEEGRKAVA